MKKKKYNWKPVKKKIYTHVKIAVIDKTETRRRPKVSRQIWSQVWSQLDKQLLDSILELKEHQRWELIQMEEIINEKM